jgi:predicted F0F1-ATPase subunit
MKRRQQDIKTHTVSSSTESLKVKTQLNENRGSSMNLLAEVSTLAWNLVIPIVGGVLLGHYLDQRFDQNATWTLSLLVLGVIVALSNLFNLYVDHGKIRMNQDEKMGVDQVNHEKEP